MLLQCYSNELIKKLLDKSSAMYQTKQLDHFANFWMLFVPNSHHTMPFPHQYKTLQKRKAPNQLKSKKYYDK
jgi:hypothetical protein